MLAEVQVCLLYWGGAEVQVCLLLLTSSPIAHLAADEPESIRPEGTGVWAGGGGVYGICSARTEPNHPTQKPPRSNSVLLTLPLPPDPPPPSRPSSFASTSLSPLSLLSLSLSPSLAFSVSISSGWKSGSWGLLGPGCKGQGGVGGGSWGHEQGLVHGLTEVGRK